MIADIFYSILILTITALAYFIRKNKKLFGGFAPTPSKNCRPRPPVGLQLPPPVPQLQSFLASRKTDTLIFFSIH